MAPPVTFGAPIAIAIANRVEVFRMTSTGFLEVKNHFHLEQRYTSG